jgi:RNA polymerase sigma factor (sigma-70 family)
MDAASAEGTVVTTTTADRADPAADLEVRPGASDAPPGGAADAPVSARTAMIWQHRPYLLAVARRRIGWHDAEDVVQEATLRALRADDIAEPQLRSWLVTTTVRLCVDRQREDIARRRRQELLAARPESSVQPGVEDEIVDREQAAWLAERVRRLPGRQSQAVRLRAKGLTVAEIGAQMEVPSKAVESLLGRARRILRQAGAAAVLTVIGARLLVKRKVQAQTAVALLGACCTFGVDAGTVGFGWVSYGVHKVKGVPAPAGAAACRPISVGGRALSVPISALLPLHDVLPSCTVSRRH